MVDHSWVWRALDPLGLARVSPSGTARRLSAYECSKNGTKEFRLESLGGEGSRMTDIRPCVRSFGTGSGARMQTESRRSLMSDLETRAKPSDARRKPSRNAR